ncbi:ImmA/IrrE family metallo-endopeptidase [Paenibacillus donghaensis]|uniref:ImmA/IrrE family metallo-endopeptidase n=1 Tax=Paenibacillus donghaensis TaxID=414771 RepID=A0A2Z2KQ04_9BACL|nr:ImmA/IrrE family metallo-endopeptidase [Paenibacillus donghaensis]ASA20898.1 ImmA/IrrE family metallo-endopeptidase [Paenibacillus donghaensis]
MDDTVSNLVKRFKTNDPFEIALRLNISVWYENLGDGTRGLYYRKLRRRFIVIHNGLDEEWQRFICAHELGHDRLHPGISRFWLDEHSLYNAGKYERQANKFAVKLLTAYDDPKKDESIREYLSRNQIPMEMDQYFI